VFLVSGNLEQLILLAKAFGICYIGRPAKIVGFVYINRELILPWDPSKKMIRHHLDNIWIFFPSTDKKQIQ